MFEIIGLLIVIGFFIGRKTAGDKASESQLEQRNFEWSQFIAGYRKKASNKDEKAMVERMLTDLKKQGLPVPTELTDAYPTATVATEVTQPAVTQSSVSAVNSDSSIESPNNYAPLPPLASPRSTATPIDNAVLLLYFGAFLFLGAVGLFLAFGGLLGGAKSALVALLVALFYGSGQWLFQTSKRFRPAGHAFIGIGLILLPFFGLSLHIDAFAQANGPVVWAITSLLAVVLYTHALITTRQAYVTYSMLVAVVSLFESGVSLASMPTYYFALAMGAVSIVFLVATRLIKNFDDLQEPLIVSSNVLLPIALLFSVIYVPSQGYLQCAFAVLLSAAFYGVYAWLSAGKIRWNLVVLSDVLAAAGLSMVAYALTDDVQSIVPVLCVFATCQLAFLAVTRQSSLVSPKLFSMLMMTTAVLPVVACFFTLSNAGLLSLVLFAAAACMVAVHTLTRDPSYIAFGVAILFTWILVMGFAWQDWSAKSFLISWLAFAVLLAGQRLRHLRTSPLGTIYRTGYLLSLLLLLLFSPFAGWRYALAATLGLSLVAVALTKFEQRSVFGKACVILHYLAILAGSAGISADVRIEVISILFTGVALLHYLLGVSRLWPSQASVFRSSGVVASLIGVFLVFFQPELHWPMLVALVVFATLSMAEYLYEKVGALFVLSVVAQFVAVPWAVSFVPSELRSVGCPALYLLLGIVYAACMRLQRTPRYYWLTASLFAFAISSITAAFYSETTIPMVVGLVLFIALSYAESRTYKRIELLLLSVTAQYILALWLATLLDYPLLPDAFTVPCAFGIVATMQYLAGQTLDKESFASTWVNSGLVGLGLGAATVLVFTETRVPMIIDLALLGLGLYHLGTQQLSQARREWGVGVVVLAIQWWFFLQGIHEVQFYTHFWALTLASFAVWRSLRQEYLVERSYTTAALCVLSGPLLIQALGASGESYGLLLIGEHVVLLILGVAIARRFVMWWGLAVATVAVLYQLRDLPFAGLGFLSVVVIGVALYILGRQKDEKQ